MSDTKLVIRSYEITKLQHGYLVSPATFAQMASPRDEYHAFETLEHALEFVREQFQKMELAA